MYHCPVARISDQEAPMLRKPPCSQNRSQIRSIVGKAGIVTKKQQKRKRSGFDVKRFYRKIFLYVFIYFKISFFIFIFFPFSVIS